MKLWPTIQCPVAGGELHFRILFSLGGYLYNPPLMTLKGFVLFLRRNAEKSTLFVSLSKINTYFCSRKGTPLGV